MNDTPFKLGWIPDKPDFRDFAFKDRPAAITASETQRISSPLVLPSSLILLPFAPGALDQGALGSCSVNATGNAVRYARMQQRKLNAFQPSRLFDYYNARAEQGWEGFDSGAYIRDAIKVTNKYGTLDESRYPYVNVLSKFTEKPPEWAYEEALNNQSISYYRLGIDPDREAFLNELKTCLAEGWPFVFGITLYSDFPWGSERGEIPMPGVGTRAIGGHALLAVGFDDATQRFTITNSWGRAWGNKCPYGPGRGTIPYEYLYRDARDFWTVRNVE